MFEKDENGEVRSPQVGDKVLWYGDVLTVVREEKKESGTVLIECEDVEGGKRKKEIKIEMSQLREQQFALRGSEHSHIAKEIELLNKKALEATLRVRLRKDLLKWWAERSVWISEGRVLSDAQKERFIEATGRKPKLGGDIAALKLLEGGS